MSENLEYLNNKFNNLIEELFEEILCDSCKSPIIIGNASAKVTDLINSDTLFLCKSCHDKIKQEIKKNH